MGKGADDLKSWIDGFIDHYVRGHGLDQRTEKAYRMDLTLFCRWMEVKTENVAEASNWQDGLEDQMDGYIDYLRIEKSLFYLIPEKQGLGVLFVLFGRTGIDFPLP